MRKDEWACNVCMAVNHETDAECQFCWCEGEGCKKDNCSSFAHLPAGWDVTWVRGEDFAAGHLFAPAFLAFSDWRANLSLTPGPVFFGPRKLSGEVWFGKRDVVIKNARTVHMVRVQLRERWGKKG